ncbi:Asp-tRNA(Asn)/Glu-tRNA(Gln) amidotransferase subunit GatC [Alphaproteobacteria bacterium]|nr:Asp-tRNA(Asn)/Glu-tRNA(Gln) amidotransferase subunit GatC [Alphaproteobacteria bacterium]
MSDIDIKRISYLAKLKLPSEKKEFYANSLKDIIKWVDNLKQIDTSEVKPLHNVTENTESIRNDEVEKNNSVEDVLNNAPERANNFFKVPKVVE